MGLQRLWRKKVRGDWDVGGGRSEDTEEGQMVREAGEYRGVRGYGRLEGEVRGYKGKPEG
jgi:hypothetical protein